ncbi:craniofacial development protein 2-like [Papaver somniferum]|uniref:craniofacial development protein 2-like n=1 Tax=Papaver somniferum TaxID=3469 RepID=UPI000E6FEEF4|nr:craniofacial development protein 2-like [Papaver somniferum]
MRGPAAVKSGRKSRDLERPVGSSRRVAGGTTKQVGSTKVRIGTWNAGSLKGRMTELATKAKEYQLNILCVQETKFVCKDARVIPLNRAGAREDSYKLWLNGESTSRNGVGIYVDQALKKGVFDVQRAGDRLIMVKILLGGTILNVITAYAPQERSPKDEQTSFWEALEGLVRSVPLNEKLFIGGDLNGHVGSDCAPREERVHRRLGYGTRNHPGEIIMDFAVSADLAVTNAFFT